MHSQHLHFVLLQQHLHFFPPSQHTRRLTLTTIYFISPSWDLYSPSPYLHLVSPSPYLFHCLAVTMFVLFLAVTIFVLCLAVIELLLPRRHHISPLSHCNHFITLSRRHHILRCLGLTIFVLFVLTVATFAPPTHHNHISAFSPKLRLLVGSPAMTTPWRFIWTFPQITWGGSTRLTMWTQQSSLLEPSTTRLGLKGQVRRLTPTRSVSQGAVCPYLWTPLTGTWKRDMLRWGLLLAV